MDLLCTDCTRLWCIYEVAVFAKLRSDLSGFVFLPIQAVWTTIALFCFHSLAAMIESVAGPFSVFSRSLSEWLATEVQSPFLEVLILLLAFTLMLAPVTSPAIWFLHKQALRTREAREDVDGDLSNFSVQELRCTVESDRVVVEDAIRWVHRPA